MSKENFEGLYHQIDLDRLPSHIAVIMDGNGRWAKSRHLPRVSGHRQGIKSVRDIVETSARLGLRVLTLYAFSVENWKRPKMEVDTLMHLLSEYLHKELRTLMENNIRFHVIGRWQELVEEVCEAPIEGIACCRKTGNLGEGPGSHTSPSSNKPSTRR